MLRAHMRLRSSLFALPVLAVLGTLAACPEPKNRPEVACAEQCEKRLAAKCDDKACARGCLFILDRLVEKEGDHVLECLSTQSSCDDRAWAECAARIGVHADGGPAAPPPKPVE